MNLEIQTSNQLNETVTQFIHESINGTLFHDPIFLSYHPESRFPIGTHRTHHLIVRENNAIIGFLPGMIIQERKKRIFQSHPGSSYGGLVLKKPITHRKVDAICSLCFESLAEMGVEEITITQTPDLYSAENAPFNNYTHYELLRRGFVVNKSDLNFAISLDEIRNAGPKLTLGEQYLESIPSKLRSEIRFALKKKMRFEVTRITNETFKLLSESQQRLGSTPTHTLEELRQLETLFPKQIFSFNTFSDSKLVAGMVGILARENVLNTFYIFDDIGARSLKAGHFNYFKVIEWALEQNLKMIDFGPSTFGFQPHPSLIFFKERFGALPYQRLKYNLKKQESNAKQNQNLDRLLQPTSH